MTRQINIISSYQKPQNHIKLLNSATTKSKKVSEVLEANETKQRIKYGNKTVPSNKFSLLCLL